MLKWSRKILLSNKVCVFCEKDLHIDDAVFLAQFKGPVEDDWVARCRNMDAGDSSCEAFDNFNRRCSEINSFPNTFEQNLIEESDSRFFVFFFF